MFPKLVQSSRFSPVIGNAFSVNNRLGSASSAFPNVSNGTSQLNISGGRFKSDAITALNTPLFGRSLVGTEVLGGRSYVKSSSETSKVASANMAQEREHLEKFFGSRSKDQGTTVEKRLAASLLEAYTKKLTDALSPRYKGDLKVKSADVDAFINDIMKGAVEGICTSSDHDSYKHMLPAVKCLADHTSVLSSASRQSIVDFKKALFVTAYLKPAVCGFENREVSAYLDMPADMVKELKDQYRVSRYAL